MRIAASAAHDEHTRSFPRGARTSRAVAVAVVIRMIVNPKEASPLSGSPEPREETVRNIGEVMAPAKAPRDGSVLIDGWHAMLANIAPDRIGRVNQRGASCGGFRVRLRSRPQLAGRAAQRHTQVQFERTNVRSLPSTTPSLVRSPSHPGFRSGQAPQCESTAVRSSASTLPSQLASP